MKESSNNNNDRNSPQKYSNNLDQDDDDDGESSPKKRKSPTKSSTKDNIQRSSSASKVGKMGKPDYSPTKLRKNVKKESEENEGEPEEDNIISTRKGKLATSSPAILHQEATKGSPSSSNLPQSSSFFQRFGLTKKPSVRVTNPKDPNCTYKKNKKKNRKDTKVKKKEPNPLKI